MSTMQMQQMVSKLLRKYQIRKDSVCRTTTILGVAVVGGHEDCVFRTLVRAGADVNAPGVPSIILAAASGNVKILDFLLSAGAELDENIKQRALRLAVDEGRMKSVRWLIAQGADVNGSHSKPLLFQAVERGHVECVRLLVRA